MRLRWLRTAILDLVQIRKYIAGDNPRAARDVASEIVTEVGHLSRHPGRGRPGRVEGTRELVLSSIPYIIPYRVKNGVIEILRVLHSAKKWPQDF